MLGSEAEHLGHICGLKAANSATMPPAEGGRRVKRRYTKSDRWYSNQANRATGAAHRRAGKAMERAYRSIACAVPLAVLVVSAAVFVGWTVV